MNSEIPRLEGDVKSLPGTSKHQGEARGCGSQGLQDVSGTDNYGRRKDWGWLGWTFTGYFPEGCSIPQLLGGVQREKPEWDPSLFYFVNCHGEKLGER